MESLEDALAVIRLTYIIFTFGKETHQVSAAIASLLSIINTFEIDSHDVANDNNIDDVGLTTSTGENKFIRRIDDEVKVNNESEQGASSNKYFMLSYFAYLRTVLLPYLPLWTRMMLNAEYNTHLNVCLHKSQTIWGKTLLDAGSTNAYAENYFAFVKQGSSKIPACLEDFIYRHDQDVRGLCRQYIGTVLESQCDIQPEVVEDWNRTQPFKKQAWLSGYYQEPSLTTFSQLPNKHFKKAHKTPKTILTSRDDQMRFQANNVANWSQVSQHCDSAEKCLEVFKNQYLQLSMEDKRTISTPRLNQQILYCMWKKTYKPSDAPMVQCNICNNWYHSTCLGMQEDYLSTVIPRYHCDTCVERVFHCLLPYIVNCQDTHEVTTLPVIAEVDKEVTGFVLETQDVIRQHIFLFHDIKRTSPSITVLRHTRGIRKEESNCWLSSVVHIVCGTGIIENLR
eukprot:gene1957-2225_t